MRHCLCLSLRIGKIIPCFVGVETIGRLLVFSGVLIRVYTSLYSGGQKNKKLLVDGPYVSFVTRFMSDHYSQFLALDYRRVLLAIAVFVFLMLHQLTVLKEEAFLGEQYGDAYRNYYQQCFTLDT